MVKTKKTANNSATAQANGNQEPKQAKKQGPRKVAAKATNKKRTKDRGAAPEKPKQQGTLNRQKMWSHYDELLKGATDQQFAQINNSFLKVIRDFKNANKA